MESTFERLFAAAQAKFPGTIKGNSDLARLLNESPQTINNWSNRGVPKAKLVDIAPLLNCTAEWLADGKTPAPMPAQPASTEVYALIPQYSTKGACGSGYYNDHVEVTGGMAFKRDWLARKGLDEHRACVIYADGDSMQPTIGDGDVLLLDQRDTTPANGQVYAVLVDEEVLVKRVQRAFGMLTLKSDNPDKTRFPDIMVPANAELYVIGKVVWRGGGL